MQKAVVVLPTYNEAGNIEQLISGIFKASKKTSWKLKVLVVDSNSPDGTADIVKNLQKKNEDLYLVKTKKEGLGRAYVLGFKKAIEKDNPDVLMMMDADLSHDPKQIPQFLSKIDAGAEFVIGSRYVKGGSIPVEWPLYRKGLSVVGNLIIRLGFMKPSITDWTSGFRAIKSRIIKDAMGHIEKYSGYVFMVATIDVGIKDKAVFKDVPIDFKDRKYGISKINPIQYMTDTLFYVFIYRLKRLFKNSL